MPHLLLLGDSTLDNGAYTGGQPAVIDQVRERFPADWKATLGAIDGSTIDDIGDQLTAMPPDTTHLLLSVGGNDAILRADLLNTPVASTGEALTLIGEAIAVFEASYRKLIEVCLAKQLPLTVCTIYNGNFPDAAYQLRVRTAIAVFDDAILRVAADYGLPVIDLRAVCSSPEHFANPIEPSTLGGSRIAQSIVEKLQNK
jgi:hypothetical protein